jgi:hypothetical protein
MKARSLLVIACMPVSCSALWQPACAAPPLPAPAGVHHPVSSPSPESQADARLALESLQVELPKHFIFPTKFATVPAVRPLR